MFQTAIRLCEEKVISMLKAGSLKNHKPCCLPVQGVYVGK